MLACAMMEMLMTMAQRKTQRSLTVRKLAAKAPLCLATPHETRILLANPACLHLLALIQAQVAIHIQVVVPSCAMAREVQELPRQAISVARTFVDVRSQSLTPESSPRASSTHPRLETATFELIEAPSEWSFPDTASSLGDPPPLPDAPGFVGDQPWGGTERGTDQDAAEPSQ